MMKKRLLHLLLYSLYIGGIIWALGSCNASRKPIDMATLNALEGQVASKNFRIEAIWALPLQSSGLVQVSNAGLLPPGSNVSRISLINTPNSFVLKGDSVFIKLPYYGERQIATNYNRADGIYLEALAEELQISKASSGKYINIDFQTQPKTERLQFNIKVYPQNRSLITIYSNQRNTIRYEGEFEDLSENY